ncbi:carbohydrate sulfotransferase 11-like [Arctopsyche grandis]|uniref:carbohydrate sulfotransferase 11-like n=1 Tax=Arctopsyche grandis TaxID=121162 RepID=UPI00406D6410
MVKVKCVSVYHCIAKTSTFFLWVLVYMLIMRLTIFKSNKIVDTTEKHLYQSNETDLWQNKWAEHFEEESNIAKNYEDYTDIEIGKLEKEHEDRRKQVWKTCVKYNLQSVGQPNHWEFFIAPHHNLVWCNIFKAASSSWMYKFNILGGYKEDFLKRSRETPLTLARKKFPRPSLDYLEASIPGSISFITVREPFERLLSAYRNKLERYRQNFYRKMGYEMIKRYRNESELIFGKIKNYGPTFFEFVKYITENYKSKGKDIIFDEHWAPYHQFCTPCQINFTIVTKVETLKRDTEYVIYQAGLESVLLKPVKEKKLRVKTIMNKAKDGKDTKTLLKKYFKQLDKKNLDDLLTIYGIDFEMFGYDPTMYYSLVRTGDILKHNNKNLIQHTRKSKYLKDKSAYL